MFNELFSASADSRAHFLLSVGQHVQLLALLTTPRGVSSERSHRSTPLDPTTQLILDASQGDRQAADALLPLVYDQLRAIAARRLQGERADHTLQPTALVNEAFLRLADQTQVNWQGKAHFCAVAATMMRRVLVDHARKKTLANATEICNE
ncbi:MAG: ECF-type sigma factor [Fuerstiella sp.]